jgi:7-carboxy-7-deazaguanine synthase
MSSPATAAAVDAGSGVAAAVPVLRLVRGEGVAGGTWQGEGSSLGRWTCYVRLYGCNLHCGLIDGVGVREDGCDTRHTWYEQEFPRSSWSYETTVEAVMADLQRRMEPRRRRGGAGMVFVTGGEPLVQGAAAGQLLAACRARGWRTEVETNGTLSPKRLGGPDQWPDQFNVSPKLTEGINHGADPAAKRIRPQAIADLLATGRAVWKFVAADVHDLEEIDWWIGEFHLPVDAVWVMPEGTSAERIIANAQELADAVLARGLNLTTRLHTLIWGAERGR